MLERSEFSLVRASVMAAVSGLLFLLGGATYNAFLQPTEVPEVHFDQQAWLRVSAVLRHIAPTAPPAALVLASASASGPASVTDTGRCTAASADYPALQQAAGELDSLLQSLQDKQFVKHRYRLVLDGMPQDLTLNELKCSDLRTAVRRLTQGGDGSGSFLTLLSWKERQTPVQQARLAEGVWITLPKRLWQNRSPWSGLPGCVFWSDARSGARVFEGAQASSSAAYCQSGASSQPDAQPPGAPSALGLGAPNLPGLSTLLAPLAAWRSPQHELYPRLVEDDNTLMFRGHAQPVGLHTQLSFDPLWQNTVQEIADCYAGASSPACSRLAPRGQERFEGARVRAAGVAIVDLASGRLVTAASANSPCYLHDQTRLGLRPNGCPSLPDDNVHRPRTPQSVLNHALFTQAPPGSLVKPLLMAGVLQQPMPQASLTGLSAALQRSDSQQFLDAFLCRQALGSGTFSLACERPAAARRSAHQLGWNTGCYSTSDWARGQCGMLDLLYGSPLAEVPEVIAPELVAANLYQPIQLPVLMGQFMVQSDLRADSALPTPAQRLACARSGKHGYGQCGGPRLGLVSEGYGQGNARTTPVGMAGLLASLGNSAQQQPLRYPHVLEGLYQADGRRALASDRPQRQGSPLGPAGLRPDISQQVLAAMETTHTPGGTAYTACSQVLGAFRCRADLGVAGKTGTPGDADERSLAQLQLGQQARRACQALKKPDCEARNPLPRPRYRWYAALFKSAGSPNYDKAIAVLVHSNWRKADGRYADHQNAAAEIAFQAIARFQEPRHDAARPPP